MVSIGYLIFAILIISFLIFIHELGHYFMARRVGMRVETFSIGFGKPIISWQRRNGERWQIGWLIFGGYVKIAGMDEEPNRDPYTIADGFYGKSPWDRIKVAAMGPIVNILFALFIFSFLWVDGGREKPFGEFTHKIGWVDPQSILYAKGIRPGDEIVSYNGYPFRGASDHLYAPMVSGSTLQVNGNHVDYKTGKKEPFQITLEPYQYPQGMDSGRLTSGIVSSASYIIYDRSQSGEENPLIEGSPLMNSGIQYGDRIVWVDGEPIYSVAELNHLINDGHILLTIQRDNQTLLRRVPRVHAHELRLANEVRDELIDWQFEAGLNSQKLRDLWVIPYDITLNNVVQGRIRFLDADTETKNFAQNVYSEHEEPLKAGDKIIAVEGTPVAFAYESLLQMQLFRVNIIVQRNSTTAEKISWLDADQDFDHQINWNEIDKIAQTIGTANPITTAGNYALLKPVAPKRLSELQLPPDKQALLTVELEQKRKQIEKIEDPVARRQAMQAFEIQEKKLFVGLPNIQDRLVEYNPIPTELFGNVFSEIFRTLSALLTGALSVKWMSGPVGIVQVVHDQSMVSIKEALFWIGAISLNLGVLNLLPVPVLDGGTIAFNLFEIITRRRFPPKILERIVFVAAVLLIGFFVFLTYNDLARLLGGFWR